MNDSPILVLGATGVVGSRIVEAIAAAGRPVRAASRAPSSDTQVAFDWNEPSTYGPAVRGAGVVHVLAPLATPRPEDLAIPFLERARREGVQRVTLLSASSVEIDGPGLGAIHAWLADSGLEWAVLRPTWFAQNLVRADHHIGRAIADDLSFVTATGSGRIAFVDAADVAAVAARALLDERSHDADHLITGPRAMSYDDVAAIASALRGRPVHHRRGTSAEAAAFMEAAGIDPPYARLLASMEVAIAAGSEDRVTDVVRSVTGHPPRTVDRVLAESLR